jgi:hypothetical protein
MEREIFLAPGISTVEINGTDVLHFMNNITIKM